jgi:hypothetical protein
MTFIKKMILSGLLLLISVSASAAEIRIDCDFSQTAFGSEHEVDRILIESGNPGAINVHYKDGALESLPPLPGVAGVFEEINFPSIISDNALVQKHYAQVMSPRLGLIQSVRVCEANSDVFCNPYSGPATLERVRFNINGKLLVFNGSSLPLCTRATF